MCVFREAREVTRSLETELQVVVNDPIWDICLGPLEEQQEFLTSLPSLQPHKQFSLSIFIYWLCFIFILHNSVATTC